MKSNHKIRTNLEQSLKQHITHSHRLMEEMEIVGYSDEFHGKMDRVIKEIRDIEYHLKSLSSPKLMDDTLGL